MKLLHSILFRIAIATIAFILASCSTAGGRVVEHGFGFDIRRASPGVEIIDYRYGDSNFPVRAPEWAVREGKNLFQ
jgi:predicted small secreted protein